MDGAWPPSPNTYSFVSTHSSFQMHVMKSFHVKNELGILLESCSDTIFQTININISLAGSRD